MSSPSWCASGICNSTQSNACALPAAITPLTPYLQQTGLNPVRDNVFIEDKQSPYVNIIVTREDNKDAQNVQDFVKSYESPEVAKAAEGIFNGSAVPGW